jgi:hypothetical protein
MGEGIYGAIPLAIRLKAIIPGEVGLDDKFLDNYVIDDRGLYEIKEAILLNHFKSFLHEFVEVSGDKRLARCLEEIKLDNADGSFWNFTNYVDFEEKFSDNYPYYCMPSIYTGANMFRTLGCVCYRVLLFYRGSYKAYLEDYSTLDVMERLFRRSMTNPLAQITKFGLFG